MLDTPLRRRSGPAATAPTSFLTPSRSGELGDEQQYLEQIVIEGHGQGEMFGTGGHRWSEVDVTNEMITTLAIAQTRHIEFRVAGYHLWSPTGSTSAVLARNFIYQDMYFRGQLYQLHNMGVATVVNVDHERRDIERVARDIRQAIRLEPIHDGYIHPAEQILMEAFDRQPEEMARWVGNYLEKWADASVSADVLRLLGRFTPHTSEWRREIVTNALLSTSVDVRDAAMQAVEAWGDAKLAAVLRSHSDTEKWLADYAAQIVRDLDGGN